MVRNSIKFVSWKDYKAVAADLKRIYQSVTEEEALLALDQFASRWDEKYPQISRSWRAHWDNICTLFKYPEDIRKPSIRPMPSNRLTALFGKPSKNENCFQPMIPPKKSFFWQFRGLPKIGRCR